MPIVVPQLDATIPDGITDLESFRRWARSDEFPEKGRFAFFNGNVWMDVSMEFGFSHNFIKTEFTSKLAALTKSKQLGHYLSDGMLLSNVEAGFSTIPDGLFITYETYKRKRIRRVSKFEHDFVELVGAPDMVLEVVSESSEEKDTVDLMESYWIAGIDEYWLADGRHEKLEFNIFRRGPKGYTPTRHLAGGWLRSAVYGHAFRFVRSIDQRGDPIFTLIVRQ